MSRGRCFPSEHALMHKMLIYMLYSIKNSLEMYLFFSDWLEKTLLNTKPTPKLVTVVNPGNPSGTYIPEPLLKVSLSLSPLCSLLLNTYVSHSTLIGHSFCVFVFTLLLTMLQFFVFVFTCLNRDYLISAKRLDAGLSWTIHTSKKI